jgi:hypothetical protein
MQCRTDSPRPHRTILESLFKLSLVLNVSLDTPAPAANLTAWMQMSERQKEAALLPPVQRATECILLKALADSRRKAAMRANEINDLLVDLIAACRQPVRAMIDAHDRMYGCGSGEAFLLGPYLEVLPLQSSGT